MAKKMSLSVPVEKHLSEMERFFDRTFSSPFLESFHFPEMMRLWKEPLLSWPRMDIKETKTEYKIIADIPGIKPEDVHVEIDGNRIVMKGTSQEKKEEKDERKHILERHSGSFYRSLNLPENVDTEQITAEQENGTLTMTLPKRAPAKSSPKSISVQKK